MRVTKILDAPVIDSDGKWMLFCQVLKGCTYTYGAIVCNTSDEAFSIREGMILDTEKNKFEYGIKGLLL